MNFNTFEKFTGLLEFQVSKLKIKEPIYAM